MFTTTKYKVKTSINNNFITYCPMCTVEETIRECMDGKRGVQVGEIKYPFC